MDDNLMTTLLDLEVPANVRISPDGKSVVYATNLKWNHRRGEHATSALWTAHVGVEKSSRKLTAGDFYDRLPAWTPDGTAIAFISDRAKAGKSHAIYLMRPEDKYEPRPITPASHEAIISQFEISPDGRYIAFASPREKSAEKKAREEGKDDAVVWGQDLDYARLNLLDTRDGSIRALFEKEAHVNDLSWNHDGSEIAFATARRPDYDSTYLHGATISVIRLADGQCRKVCHVPLGLQCLTWSGSKIYFLASNRPDDHTTGTTVYSTSDSDQDCGFERSAYGVDDSPTYLQRAGSDLMVHVERGMDDQIRLLSGRPVVSSSKQISGFDVSFVAADDGIIAIIRGDINHPTEVFSLVGSGADPIQLSDHGSSLADTSFGTCLITRCRSLDDKETLNGLFVTPKDWAGPDGKPKEPLPTVVLIHGGPYSRSIDSFDFLEPRGISSHLLLAAGYGILFPNYRGSSGQGERFASYAGQGLGLYDEPDIVALTQNAIERGYADRSRLVVCGWSQGGYLSYLSAVRNGRHGFGWKFRGAIPGAGITDWEAMAITSDIGFFEKDFTNGTQWTVDPSDTRTRVGSPLREFGRAAKEGSIPPLLMLHGEKDERVPVTQAWGFRRALDEAGLPFEFVTYPREGHCLEERKHLEDMLRRLVRFVEKCTS